ncbi:MAG: sulfurtransferase [Bryobacterales bacterium]|nr:sulfurtransferase [Bryobacterales bacterium]
MLVALLSLCPMVTAETRSRMLTTAQDLASRLNRPEIVVLHVGTETDYTEAHVPGARLLKLSDVSKQGTTGLRVEMPGVDALREALLKVGVRDGSSVVLYGPNIVQTARVWFTFDYLGLGDKTSILDGGLAAWKTAGRQVSKDAAPALKEGGKLTVRPKPDLIVDSAWINSKLAAKKTAIVDARLPEFYTGAQPGNGMPRAGHIPSAVNVPYSSLVDSDQRFLSPDALRAKLGAAAPPVVYCHIGMQATVAYFASRYIGLHPRLYDGSWQDWSRRTEFPVEK